MAYELTRRIQSLPPELFNQIRDNVLNSSATTLQYIRVTPTYKFPAQLHVNKACREQFGMHYFSKAIFIVESHVLFEKFATTMEDAQVKCTKGYRVLEGRAARQGPIFGTEILLRADRLGVHIEALIHDARALRRAGEPFLPEDAAKTVYYLQNHGSSPNM